MHLLVQKFHQQVVQPICAETATGTTARCVWAPRTALAGAQPCCGWSASAGVPFDFCMRKAYIHRRGPWLLLVLSLLVHYWTHWKLIFCRFRPEWPSSTLTRQLASFYQQRDKRKETERTQNKRLQVCLSKQATKVYNYFSVCTAMLVNLLTVFAYFHSCQNRVRFYVLIRMREKKKRC